MTTDGAQRCDSLIRIRGSADAGSVSTGAWAAFHSATGGVAAWAHVVATVGARGTETQERRQRDEMPTVLVERRLQERPSCASLFTELGKDGMAVIKRTLYYPANVLMERRICWRSYAFTKVGVRPTWICRRMWLQPISRFALVLLHEALHHAGLDEWPHAKAAQDSHSVIGRVATACGF